LATGGSDGAGLAAAEPLAAGFALAPALAAGFALAAGLAAGLALAEAGAAALGLAAAGEDETGAADGAAAPPQAERATKPANASAPRLNANLTCTLLSGDWPVFSHTRQARLTSASTAATP
jgi:hypothetical protein